MTSQASGTSTVGSLEESQTTNDPRAAFEAYVASVSPEEASSKLTTLIRMNRAQLKSRGVPIPKATSPILISLMDSLKALPSTEISARIAIVTALGRMSDPAVLPLLLLATSSQSRDVRKATAIALGGIRHPLAAYLLLPMLQDGSSRVRQAAFQALIQLNQPQTIHSVVAACLCSKTLRTLILETLRLVSESKRNTFFELLRQMPVNEHPELQTVANWLRFEFKETPAAAPNTQSNAIAKSAKPATSAATSQPEYSEGQAPAKSQEVENSKQLAAQHKLRTPAEVRDEATGQASGSSFQAPKKSPSALPARRGKQRSHESSIFSWGKPEKTQTASVNGPASIRRQNSGGSAVAESPSVDSYEMTADFDEDDEFESDVRLLSDSSAADQRFFNSMVDNLLATSQNENDSVDHSTSPTNSDALQEFSSISGLLSGPEDPQQVHGRNDDDDDDRSELEFASNGSQAFMSLSGMLEAPKLPPQHNQRNSPPIQPGSTTFRVAAVSGQTSSSSPAVPRTSTPHSAFDTATVMGNTPGSSVPMMPFVHPTAKHPGAIPPSVAPMNGKSTAGMNPAGMPGPPAFDMTASSPLVPAFTTATPHAAAVSATLHAAGPASSDISTSVGQASEASALIMPALADGEEHAIEEQEAEQVRARLVHEKALARLSAAREDAFRVLLKDADDFPKTLPRLLRKRVSALMATPSTKTERIAEQIRELGETNSPAALAILATFSQKPAKQIREACAEALGGIIHPGSAVLLMKLLADKSGTVVEATIKSLAKLDMAPTWPVLMAAGLCGSNLRTVVTAGVESSADEKKPEWEEFLLESLRCNDTDNSAFAVSLLARIAGETHLEIFQKLASHKAPELRAAAVEALSRTQAKRAISQINAALEDPEPSVRAQAALSVATMYSPRSIELLQKLVFDTNLNVRRNAAQSMSKIDETELSDTIATALKHETDGTTVESLLSALQRNGGASSLPILQRYIEGEGTQFREQAVKALRKLKIPASVPVFRRLLDDHTPTLRRQSIEQLTVLKCEGVLPNFREMLKQDPDETVRSACAKALGEFGDETSLHLLEEALQDHPIVRLQAVISLGRMGEASAGPTLLTMLQDQLPEIRYQAVRALAQLKLDGCEESVVPLLQDADQMVRRGAEQTLQDLGMTVSQIRGRQVRKRIVSILSMLAPSTIAGAMPGGAKSLLAVLLLVTIGGGGWGLWNARSLLGAGESLPTTSVVAVAVSASEKQAYVLRKLDILDVWKLDSSTLDTRVKAPPGTHKVIAESGGGILLLSDSSVVRFSAESDFSPENAQSLQFGQRPSAICYHPKTNSLCVFEGTSLRQVDATTLEDKKKWTLKQPYNGNCIVSPDMKLALMLAPNGTLTLCDLNTGEMFTANVAQMAGQTSLQQVLCVTFTDDMKYVCFGTTGEFIALEVETMTLVKHLQGAGAFDAIYAVPGTSNVLAVSSSRKVFSFKNAFQDVEDPKVDVLGDFNVFDQAGELIICAFREEPEAFVYDIGQKKTVAELIDNE